MLERAGTGVAIHAKPSVQEAAKHRINHGDLTSILYLQGYSRDAFVTP
jgi:phosphoserine phosphatase